MLRDKATSLGDVALSDLADESDLDSVKDMFSRNKSL
jgi:hypothetical protein